MGEPTTRVENISIAPLYASGFITDGKFLKFSSPYPQSGTKFHGVDISLDFLKDDLGAFRPKPRRFGQLALIYYYGKSDDQFDESDLPLGDNPIAGLIRFNARRDARSHWLFSEWRFPLFSPVHQSEHLRLIQPQYSLGLGGMYISTTVNQDGDIEHVHKYAGYVTGATQLRIVEVSLGRVNLSWEASIRMLAGQTYGIMAESSARLSIKL